MGSLLIWQCFFGSIFFYTKKKANYCGMSPYSMHHCLRSGNCYSLLKGPESIYIISIISIYFDYTWIKNTNEKKEPIFFSYMGNNTYCSVVGRSSFIVKKENSQWIPLLCKKKNQVEALFLLCSSFFLLYYHCCLSSMTCMINAIFNLIGKHNSLQWTGGNPG